MRRRLAHWFLAAALVCAQLGIQAHALGHLDEALHGHDAGHGHSDHGEETCLAFDTASGCTATPAALPLGGGAPANVRGLAAADPLLPALALTRFASRAPPL
jgi:hypothetical protein